jgi:hypothetical protein
MSDNTQEKGNQTGSAKRGFAIIIVFLVIIIALVAVIAFLLGRNTGVSDTSDNENSRELVESSRVVLDEDSAANVMDEMRKEVEEGMFACNMSMTWTFENGEAESKDAFVANNPNNTHPIYFDLYLEDTGELIYSSPIIPVGSQLTNFKLDKALPVGTYDAKCAYSLLKDEESQEVTSNVNFIITINVLN